MEEKNKELLSGSVWKCGECGVTWASGSHICASQPAQGVGLTEAVAALKPSTPLVYAPVQGAAYRHGYKDAVSEVRAILARQTAPTRADDEHEFLTTLEGSAKEATDEWIAGFVRQHFGIYAAPTQDSAQAPQETIPQGDEHATVKRIRELCDGLTINQLKATLDGWLAAAPQQPAAERGGVKAREIIEARGVRTSLSLYAQACMHGTVADQVAHADALIANIARLLEIANPVVTSWPEACKWPQDKPFRVLKVGEPGDHTPWQIVMPCGGVLELNHHADDAVDEARAKWIGAALNLPQEDWSPYLKEDETPLARLEREIADNATLLSLLAKERAAVPEGWRDTLDTAAGYLEHYAQYCYEVKPADIERHPYIPSIEQAAEELRAMLAAAPSPAALVAQEGEAVRENCNWTLDDEENGIWQSACGETWSFVAGGPVENFVRFCQGCGKPVHLAQQTSAQVDTKGGEA